jgi:hypothetical protein
LNWNWSEDVVTGVDWGAQPCGVLLNQRKYGAVPPESDTLPLVCEFTEMVLGWNEKPEMDTGVTAGEGPPPLVEGTVVDPASGGAIHATRTAARASDE